MSHQIEIKQKYPQEGWVEQDPKEILQAVMECIKKTMDKLKDVGLCKSDIKAIGITNQRETTLVWDKNTGEPLHNAIGKKKRGKKEKISIQKRNFQNSNRNSKIFQFFNLKNQKRIVFNLKTKN